MRQKLGLVLLSLLLAVASQEAVWAGNILERIKETGVITAGTRKNAVPFGYVNDKGEWVGYSLDILELIRQQAQEQLKRPIQLKLVEVTPQDRLAKIKDGSIDIECSSTTFTWEREQEVDFSVSYFASGTQLLVKKGSGLGSAASLTGKRIGVIPKTTNEAVIAAQQPAAQLIPVKDRSEAWEKLQKGEIDGFAGDGIILVGMKQQAPNPQAYEVVPEFPYQYESYGCLLPHDQSAWRDLVNYSLIKFMEGITSDRSETVAIYERWFGEEGVAPYSRETINDYFEGIVNGYEWIPLVKY